MFDNFSTKISKIFDSISGKKFISEDDLSATMREIRIALLEADVSLAVAKDFIEKVKAEANGKEVVKSISAGQMVVKIVHDELVKLLGSEKSELNLNVKQPAIIMLVGLQGAGKSTTAGKLASLLKNKKHKKVLLASLDTYRPAAQEQLEILAKKVGVEVVEIIADQKPLEITKRAIQKAELLGSEVLILDTAGRTHLNEELMQELSEIKKIANPSEILLTVDALIGQDAINVAKSFNERLEINGVILTRLDGDSRGGAALTMKSATNCAIKFIGVGEKLDELEEFNPSRIASRIIGMGDVVSLVEKAQEMFDVQEMEKSAKKMQKGQFDLNDLLSQIRNMKKMGGIGSIIKFLPGASKLKEHIGKISDTEKEMIRQEALILSMTKKERANPELLNSSRKFRIAKGAGSNIQEVNRLLKKYKQIQKMMKKFGKIDPRKMAEMMDEKEMSKLKDFVN
ncbi:MAG: signal recognition particle protein [Pelagibacterales bacterium]|nr:signal recognition particle protein [Pelagibacterales bacterium]